MSRLLRCNELQRRAAAELKIRHFPRFKTDELAKRGVCQAAVATLAPQWEPDLRQITKIPLWLLISSFSAAKGAEAFLNQSQCLETLYPSPQLSSTNTPDLHLVTSSCAVQMFLQKQILRSPTQKNGLTN